LQTGATPMKIFKKNLVDTLGIIAKSKADFETLRREISDNLEESIYDDAEKYSLLSFFEELKKKKIFRNTTSK